MAEKRCHRCGRCCHYIWHEKKKKCKYLVMHGRIASCRIYKNRAGTILEVDESTGRYIFCAPRDGSGTKGDDMRFFDGCEFNVEKKK